MTDSRPDFSSLLHSLSLINLAEMTEENAEYAALSQPSALGAPLELGKCLFQDLNNAYIGWNSVQ